MTFLPGKQRNLRQSYVIMILSLYRMKERFTNSGKEFTAKDDSNGEGRKAR